MDPDTLSYAFLFFYVDESFYIVILAITKISILLFYLRIFPQQWFRRACLACIGWIATSGLVFLFLQIFQCRPLSFVWLGWKGGGGGGHTCLNVSALTYTAAGFSIAQDVVVFVMPIPLLTNLNASMRKRSQILFMFSMGFFVLLTSCIRLGFMVHFAASWNPTWDYAGPLIWSGLELGVSMIVTSLPAIRVMLTRTMLHAFGGSHHRHSYNNNNNIDINNTGGGGSRSSIIPPMGYAGVHPRAAGYVKSQSSSKNQPWTSFTTASGGRSRLDDEESEEVELATRVEVKEEEKEEAPPVPAAPDDHLQRGQV